MKEVALFPESLLASGVALEHVERDDLFAEVAVVRFSGEYRMGSAGNPDAEHMAAVLGAVLARFDPDAVVLDLRELTYAWGNGLLRLFDVLERWETALPVGCAVAAGPGCLFGLASLITPRGAARPELLKSDLAAALAHAEGLALERARRIG